MKVKKFSTALLEYLPSFPSAQQVPINAFLKTRPEKKEIIKAELRGLIANSFIHSIDNLDEALDKELPINTNITGSGYKHLTEENLRENTKWATKHPYLHALVIAFIGAAISQLITLGVQKHKDQEQSQLDTQQFERLKSLSDSLYNLQTHIKDSCIHKTP